MSRNQFFYKRLVKAEKEGEQDEYVFDSFNLELVIRSFWTAKDGLTVLIADGHEDSFTKEVPKFQKGKFVEMEHVKGPREYVQSQITLDLEDAARFRNASEVYGFAGDKVPYANEGLVVPASLLKKHEEELNEKV